MDFGFTAENEAFREEVRQFIVEHSTPEVQEIDMAVAYAKERVAFGRPIGAFKPFSIGTTFEHRAKIAQALALASSEQIS